MRKEPQRDRSIARALLLLRPRAPHAKEGGLSEPPFLVHVPRVSYLFRFAEDFFVAFRVDFLAEDFFAALRVDFLAEDFLAAFRVDFFFAVDLLAAIVHLLSG